MRTVASKYLVPRSMVVCLIFINSLNLFVKFLKNKIKFFIMYILVYYFLFASLAQFRGPRKQCGQTCRSC